MKMDRDINPDGKGKYAILLLRNMPKPGTPQYEAVMQALGVLTGAQMLDYGEVGTSREFFLIRLRDEYAHAALIAYQEAIMLGDKPDNEYAQAVMDMALRSGKYSEFCKKPD